jgi:DNA-binding transcriptional MerR regulator
VYADLHVDRLRAISVMQARGLQLSAIRDLLSLDAPDRLSVWQWLGLQADAIDPLGDAPLELDEAALHDRLGADHLDLLRDLHEAGLVEALPDGRYRLARPKLLDITLDFHDAGVHVRTSSVLGLIIAHHLSEAAEEILTYVRRHMGESFSDSTAPGDIARTLEVVDRRAGEAVSVLWNDVMRDAVRDFRDSLQAAFGAPADLHGGDAPDTTG